MAERSAVIEVVTGDITHLRVDAIVNAANDRLLGGGGVDGAIHRAAGPGLLEECRALRGCPTGQAKRTGGYELSAKHVIHTVGPVWRAGDEKDETPIGGCEEDALLASCYDESLHIAAANGVVSIAFPAISTGVYRFPKQRAAVIAVGRVKAWSGSNELPAHVVFCCFSDADAGVYREVIRDSE